uniref:tRNA selenocysteine-associated protein 1 n=1 Tax=Angiostrongylus cantonensis TaxID=6313 RepID=A0A0K0DB50_ANGCA
LSLHISSRNETAKLYFCYVIFSKHYSLSDRSSQVFGSLGITLSFLNEALQTCAYCFVEFATTDEARDAMLRANGHKVPNSEPRSRFNLSFANDPRVPSIEFNLFVNNIHPDIDDAALYQVFGARYRSCRGAKVYRNRDGSSRCLGFIRFGDQTEQQMALVCLFFNLFEILFVFSPQLVSSHYVNTYFVE